MEKRIVTAHSPTTMARTAALLPALPAAELPTGRRVRPHSAWTSAAHPLGTGKRSYS